MKWLITYHTASNVPLFIVIHSDTRADARAMLKRHMKGETFKIDKMEELKNENH